MRRRKRTDDDKRYFNLLWIRNWATAIINLKKHLRTHKRMMVNACCELKRTIFWALLPSNTWNWSQNSSFCSTSFTFKLIKGYAITRKKGTESTDNHKYKLFLKYIKKSKNSNKDKEEIIPTKLSRQHQNYILIINLERSIFNKIKISVASKELKFNDAIY